LISYLDGLTVPNSKSDRNQLQKDDSKHVGLL